MATSCRSVVIKSSYTLLFIFQLHTHVFSLWGLFQVLYILYMIAFGRISSFNDSSWGLKDCTSVFVVCSVQFSVLDEVMDKLICHGNARFCRDKPTDPCFKCKKFKTRHLPPVSLRSGCWFVASSLRSSNSCWFQSIPMVMAEKNLQRNLKLLIAQHSLLTIFN